MRMLIVKSFETIAYGAIVLVVLGFGGLGAGLVGGFLGFLLGSVGGLVVSIILFGALFLLVDIADNTRRMMEALAADEAAGAPEAGFPL